MRDEMEDVTIVVNKFNEESVKDFRRKVERFAAMDPNMPIVIYIDSYGGSLDSFNTMLSIMKGVSNPFVTVCQGKAMSAGAALLAMGDIRFCDSDSRVMIHEASGGAVGHSDDIKTDAKEHDRINRHFMGMIAAKCGKTYEQLKNIIKDNEGRDLYLTAQQAKDFGIVDFIGLPQIKGEVSYSVGCLPPKAKVKVIDQTKEVTIVTKKKTVKKKTKTDSKKSKKK